MKATMTLGTGGTIECLIHSYDITYERDDFCPPGDSAIFVNYGASISVEGMIVNMDSNKTNDKVGDEVMETKADQLAVELNELGLTSEQRKLREFGIVDAQGLLTHKGIEVVMNELFTPEIQKSLVERLDKLDEAVIRRQTKTK